MPAVSKMRIGVRSMICESIARDPRLGPVSNLSSQDFIDKRICLLRASDHRYLKRFVRWAG